MNDRRLRIGVNGAAGRMGQMLTRLIAKSDHLELLAALEDSEHDDLGRDMGILTGLPELGVPLTDQLPDVKLDVMVDFSSPEATAECARQCARREIPVVIGTTGLDNVQLDAVMAASAEIPLVFAPNMSVGVNVLLDLVTRAAEMLGADYDVEIVETHHRFKKDAPSGTALKLAERIADVFKRDPATDLVHGRQGKVGLRSQR